MSKKIQKALLLFQSTLPNGIFFTLDPFIGSAKQTKRDERNIPISEQHEKVAADKKYLKSKYFIIHL